MGVQDICEDPVTSAVLAEGDQQAASQLMPAVYREPRQMAARDMRQERVDHTLQTTALVHKAHLKLVDQSSAKWQNRAIVFGVASQVVRHNLIDHALANMRKNPLDLTRSGERRIACTHCFTSCDHLFG